MARQESDREDLLAEATALVRRAEWVRRAKWTDNSDLSDLKDSDQEGASLFGGFRRDGSVSLYFGADPVYHFDPHGRLKRAYALGRLYRTQGTTLARFARRRTAEETQLVRHDLNRDECEDFLAEMNRQIANCTKELKDRRLVLLRKVPENDTELERDFLAALERILEVPAGQRLARRFRGKR